MRIVAGTAKGRTLATPKSDDVIRPTADRVRQTLFDLLGQRLDPVEVLDLFAGTGALGLEALSRGAARAVLVDSGSEAISLCRENAGALGFEGRVEVLGVPWERALALLSKSGRRFQLVFSDPPYALEAAAVVLSSLETHGLLDDGAVAVMEHSQHEAVAQQVGAFLRVDQRRFGETTVSIFRLTRPLA